MDKKFSPQHLMSGWDTRSDEKIRRWGAGRKRAQPTKPFRSRDTKDTDKGRQGDGETQGRGEGLVSVSLPFRVGLYLSLTGLCPASAVIGARDHEHEKQPQDEQGLQ
jgi:hypothetical protein